MLSYLHSFHAGNFADVLKHSISRYILNYLTEKPKALVYIDTHSGVGGFELSHSEMQKTQEYLNGIAKLWPLLNTTENAPAVPEMVADYLDLVALFNQQNHAEDLAFYPGSPWFAKQILRDHDRLNLFELHPREFKNLQNNMVNDRRIKITQSDGFQAYNSLFPPPQRRGYLLMDPPYEVKTDYQTAVQSLIKAHKKFAVGCYALWYPVVDRARIDQLEKQLIDSGIRNIQLFELAIDKDENKGMTASGMIVINPPWKLKQAAEESLPFLVQQLAPKNGFYRCLQLVDE